MADILFVCCMSLHFDPSGIRWLCCRQWGSHHLCLVLAAAGGRGFPGGGQDVPPWRAAGTFWENFCNEGMVGEENPASRTCSTGETEKGRERTARQSSESDKKETCHAQTL